MKYLLIVALAFTVLACDADNVLKDTGKEVERVKDDVKEGETEQENTDNTE